MNRFVLNYSINLADESALSFAKHLGYRGEDVEEAIRDIINPAFLQHVSSWMSSQALLKNDPDFSIIDQYKKLIKFELTKTEESSG